MQSFFKSLKNRKVNNRIPIINVKRGFYASLVCVVIMPFLYMTTASFSRDPIYPAAYARHFMMLLIESVVFIMLAKLVLGSRRKVAWSRILYRLYYFIIGATLISLAYNDFKSAGSLFFYFMTMLFFAVVPVLKAEEFMLFTVVQLGVVLAFLLKYPKEPMFILQIVILNVVAELLTIWKYYSIYSNLDMELQLKSETVVSEMDPLTGLINRRGLERKTDIIWPLCIKEKVSLAVVMMDIDFFKYYNDSFGHPMGDKCLQCVADAIKKTARRNTDMIARIGGEEFVVVLKDMDRSEVVMLAKNIQRCIADMGIEQSYKKVSNNLTISIGIAFRDQEASDSFEKLYKKADTALYLAKTNGRNCIAFGHNIIAKGRRKKADEYDINYNEYSAKVVGER